MTVVGTGVDLVEVPRFQKSIERWGGRFLERIFTPLELSYAQSRKTAVQHLAARFAAKEAVVKALGAPKGLGLQWSDLEVTNASTGQPQVVFHGSLQRWRPFKIHLSITHTSDYAIATALAVAP